MADDKDGREEQARHADRRQRERDVREQLERRDEPEPPVDVPVLADLETSLESVTFPATGADVVAAVGDRTVESTDGTYPIAALVPESEEYGSPESVQERVQRPTVALAMTRVVAASRSLRADLRGSKYDAYDRTFRELRAIDALDDDEGIRVVADWIVDRIAETGKLPESRDVRRQAANVARDAGHEVRTDEWLGV